MGVPVITPFNSCVGGGTVTFTQSGAAAGGTWSVSGGGTIDANTGVFTPSTPGCFTVTYKTTGPACTDTKSFVVFPAAPVLTATNTCNTAFALPTVTAVTGFSAQYSINGGGWTASPTIPTTPGCYSIQARYILATACGTNTVGTVSPGCVSNIVNVVIFPQPTISAPANTCASAFVLPTVTPVAGFTVEYSIDGGAFSASPGVPTTPGCHSVQARYVLANACGSNAIGTANTTCYSNIVNVVIFPAAPTPVVNNGCGAIVVTPPPTVAGFDVQYSFNDGSTWGGNSPPTADNCTGYKIKVRYVTNVACGSIPAGTVAPTGCESPAVTRTVDNTPPTVTGQATVTGTQCNVQPAFLAPTPADNCSTPTLKAGYPQDGTITAGANCTSSQTRTWIYVDACGNESAPFVQTATWKTDIIPPTVNCPTVPPICEVTGKTYIIPPMTASDNCSANGALTITYSITGATTRTGTGVDASGIFEVGVSTITWTVKDECGNTNSCSTQVTIDPKPVPLIYHN
jgi:hypothetical protein